MAIRRQRRGTRRRGWGRRGGGGCRAVVYYFDHPDCKPKELMKFVRGPDFPTGAVIVGSDGIKEAYETGRGSIRVRAVCSIEEGIGGRGRGGGSEARPQRK